ncbi:hypothetical protein [Bifidobacterium indicum]|uniref:hypothetical protein n=1 Tax=Bifidobacterium indicum TaxID=1691 RepID=UPI0030D6CF14
MKKRLCTLTIICLLMGGLSACGTNNTSQASNSPAQSPTTHKPQPSPSKNTRGNLVKHIGETAGIRKSESSQTLIAQWNVNSITIDQQCTVENHKPPADGHHLVGLDIDASTTKDFTEPEYGVLMLGSPAAWKFISSDGTLSNSTLISDSSENCLPQEQLLPYNIGQGLRAHGIVVLDAPSTDGFLRYSNGPSTGWEYPLS